MTLPSSQRKADVLSKLEYVGHRRNAVMDELFAAKKETRDPKFLIHAAAEVVATARETFDYLGRAIIARRRVVHLRSPLIRLSASNWTATVNKDEIGMLASHYQVLDINIATRY